LSSKRTQAQERIRWRRDKVKELRNKGYTQRDIAAELQVSLKLVNKDLQLMISEADKKINHYTDIYLPAEHERCLDTLDTIIKEMWAMETEDNRELIQSRTLIKDCSMLRLDLVGSGKVIERAAKYIQKQRELMDSNHNQPQSLTDQNSKVTTTDVSSRTK
jgi:hypothetical protein